MNEESRNRKPLSERHCSKELLGALHDGNVAPEFAILAEAHLRECEECREKRRKVAAARQELEEEFERELEEGEKVVKFQPVQTVSGLAAHVGELDDYPRVADRGFVPALAADSGDEGETIPCQTGIQGFHANLHVLENEQAKIEVWTSQTDQLNAMVSFRVGFHPVEGLRLVEGTGLTEGFPMTRQQVDTFDGWLDDFEVGD